MHPLRVPLPSPRPQPNWQAQGTEKHHRVFLRQALAWLEARSTVTRKAISKLTNEGFLPENVWRIPDVHEMEPHPRPNKWVLLTSHLQCGFSLLSNPFSTFCSFPRCSTSPPSPNAIARMSFFVSLYENFIAIIHTGHFGCRLLVSKSTRWRRTTWKIHLETLFSCVGG